MNEILINTKYIPNNKFCKIKYNNKNILRISSSIQVKNINNNSEFNLLLNTKILEENEEINIYKYYRIKKENYNFIINLLNLKYNNLLLTFINNIIIPGDKKTNNLIKYMLKINIGENYNYSLYICNSNKVLCLFTNNKKVLDISIKKISQNKKILKHNYLEIIYIEI